MREVEEKKNPRIPPWKVWILIIVTIQLIAAFQSHRVHQQMWETIFESNEYLIQSLENQNQYNSAANTLFEWILNYLKVYQ